MYGSKGGMAFSSKGSSVSQVWRRGRGRSGGRGGRGVCGGRRDGSLQHSQISCIYKYLAHMGTCRLSTHMHTSDIIHDDFPESHP